MDDQSLTDNDDINGVTIRKKRKANSDNYVRNPNKLARLHNESYIIKKGKEMNKKTVGIPCKQSATQSRSKRNVFSSIRNWWSGTTLSPLDKLIQEYSLPRIIVIAPSYEWEVLTFSQLWPYTFCHAWLHTNPKVKSCNLPPNHNQWTVHGIWPTKLGVRAGPFYCSTERPFDVHILEPIIPDLKHRWTDIKSNGPGLWRYEWLKHGTCALSHPYLNTELKYFKQALLWSKKYMMSDILGQAGVNPNDSYPLELIYEAVRYRLGKNPRIQCIHEKTTGRYYLKEIRLCFNKNLELIDCVNHVPRAKYNTNCPLVREVFYIGAAN